MSSLHRKTNGASLPPVDRTLHADGLANARDLGGLPRRDGSPTPSGVYFRAENVDQLTQAGWQQVHDAGVRSVLDLRQPSERAADRSPRPAWLTTLHVDHDGLDDHPEFWADYWDSGLVGTALYYLPHLAALPERTGEVLTALTTAPEGGVLFHCMGGRDRTGLVAAILLLAADVDPEAIVDDYLETVRRGDLRAATSNRNNAEAELEALCATLGTSTEGAFRDALAGLDLERLLDDAAVPPEVRDRLFSWRGALV
jgi:protein tyrosine/serine phosphatase